ncbi:hypothetical protein PAXRUDRAFT_805345 [Paxillus rubicundulus Ve08.2h10]|uniref:Uncharacterized protein n=1 Tax=Paxillus rubicundulus Ve08.2h10 TaxID=930991 RepID=A0A0D0DKC8_9AGAM|nr:hypothetical protein PAXRUDRAFT_805345 [Paxillus rubicundulus Ve08.2h10]
MSRLPRESEVVVRAIKSKQNVSRTEHIRITKRRIEKAERDERVDIGMILTPPKTYMGGFTRPRDLRVFAWSKGGQLEKRKVYESPTPDAYVPHTVYVLEGRYPSKRSRERALAHEHIVGFCRESDFPKVLQRYNSEHTSKDLLEAMDTAQWPWLPKKRGKCTTWWKDDDERIATLREVYGHDAEVDTVKDDQSQGVDRALNIDPSYISKAPSQFSTGSQQMRGFHTSARVRKPTSYNADGVIPDFYITNKQSRGNSPPHKYGATSSTTSPDTTSTDVEAAEPNVQEPVRPKVAMKRRKHEGSALMEQLSDSILSDEVAASTRRLKSKIPVEHYDVQGNLVLHPSGFVVPGPGHSSTSDVARAKERERDEGEDRATQKAAVAERVLESDLDNVHASVASTRPRSHKVPFEVREPDGTVKHPSGFVPPTPANKFKHSDSASLDRDLSASIGRQRAREASVSGAISKMGRAMHTTAVVRASEAYSTPIRAQYLPTLSSQPFFRPLLTLTFSTRPLAEVVARLSKALPRGLSYVAAVDPEDRKYGPSFSNRVRNMRLARMQGLTMDVAQLLAGARGGLLGARFGAEERGRGVDGEGFGEPVEYRKRVVGVGVGNWLGRAEEVKEAFRTDGVERVWGEGVAFKAYGLDDWGKRIDDVSGEEIAYPEHEATRVSTLKLAEDRMEGLEESKRKTPVLIAEAGELVQRKSSLEEAHV